VTLELGMVWNPTLLYNGTLALSVAFSRGAEPLCIKTYIVKGLARILSQPR